MSEAWHPIARETDPLTAAVLDVIRERVSTVIGKDMTVPMSLGEARAILPDGSDTVIALSVAPAQRGRFGKRAALTYDLRGQAACRGHGFAIIGRATIDLKTQAFYDISVDIADLGGIRRDS
ncbi:MAG: hypothetical protein AAFX39_10955 [Pseudomonadota bacterium]